MKNHLMVKRVGSLLVAIMLPLSVAHAQDLLDQVRSEQFETGTTNAAPSTAQPDTTRSNRYDSKSMPQDNQGYGARSGSEGKQGPMRSDMSNEVSSRPNTVESDNDVWKRIYPIGATDTP